MNIVAKFGGSVLSIGEYWKKILDLLNQNSDRRTIVVSAPGKRFLNDNKITDMLIKFCYNNDFKQKKVLWENIALRYKNIAEYFKVKFDDVLEQTEACLNEADKAFVVSRGEYLSSKLFAKVSGFRYVEADKCVKFDINGNLLTKLTIQLLYDALKDEKCVLGGFYGSDVTGKTVLFDRGGSDVTGALVAAATNADIYENWTDVSGVYVCDPRVILNPVKLRCISYQQLKILSTLGAEVLHADSVYPLINKKIPINVKSVFNPFDSGTLIAETASEENIIGITCRLATKLTLQQTKSNPLLNAAEYDGRNLLYCCQNAGFSEYFFKEELPSSFFNLDVDKTINKTALLSVLYSGQNDTAKKISFALKKKKIPHRPLCQNEFLVMTEVSTDASTTAVKAVYDYFFA